MPIIKSAIKRMRSSRKKHARNQDVRTELKSRYKKIVQLVEQNLEEAKKEATVLISQLDRAARRWIIPKQTANRKKSRLAKLLAKLKK